MMAGLDVLVVPDSARVRADRNLCKQKVKGRITKIFPNVLSFFFFFFCSCKD